MANGEYWPCLRSSVSLSPLFNSFWVDTSKSEPNWAKAAISLYWANSNLIEPATCFIPFTWAAEPTLLTDSPTLIAGLIPW